MNKALRILFTVIDIVVTLCVLALVFQHKYSVRLIAEYSTPSLEAGERIVFLGYGMNLLNIYLVTVVLRGIYNIVVTRGIERETVILRMLAKVFFLCTVLGAMQVAYRAFSDIMVAGDISPNVIAGWMKLCIIIIIIGLSLTLIPLIGYWYNRRNYRIPSTWKP